MSRVQPVHLLAGIPVAVVLAVVPQAAQLVDRPVVIQAPAAPVLAVPVAVAVAVAVPVVEAGNEKNESPGSGAFSLIATGLAN